LDHFHFRWESGALRQLPGHSANVRARGEESGDDVAADIAGRAGDENCAGHKLLKPYYKLK
jgi:hypothetical protein